MKIPGGALSKSMKIPGGMGISKSIKNPGGTRTSESIKNPGGGRVCVAPGGGFSGDCSCRQAIAPPWIPLGYLILILINAFYYFTYIVE